MCVLRIFPVSHRLHCGKDAGCLASLPLPHHTQPSPPLPRNVMSFLAIRHMAALSHEHERRCMVAQLPHWRIPSRLSHTETTLHFEAQEQGVNTVSTRPSSRERKAVSAPSEFLIRHHHPPASAWLTPHPSAEQPFSPVSASFFPTESSLLKHRALVHNSPETVPILPGSHPARCAPRR